MKNNEVIGLIRSFLELSKIKDEKLEVANMRIEILERKLARYEEKEFYELVGNQTIGDKNFSIYEKFDEPVPDFVSDDDITKLNKAYENGEIIDNDKCISDSQIAELNANAPKFDSAE